MMIKPTLKYKDCIIRIASLKCIIFIEQLLYEGRTSGKNITLSMNHLDHLLRGTRTTSCGAHIARCLETELDDSQSCDAFLQGLAILASYTNTEFAWLEVKRCWIERSTSRRGW